MQIVEIDGLDAAATARAFRQAAASELVLVGDWGPIEEVMMAVPHIASAIIRTRLARNLMRWELADTILVIGSAVELAARGLPDVDGDAAKTVQAAIHARMTEAATDAHAITGQPLSTRDLVELGALWATSALRLPVMHDDKQLYLPTSLAQVRATLEARTVMTLLGFPPEALAAIYPNGVTS